MQEKALTCLGGRLLQYRHQREAHKRGLNYVVKNAFFFKSYK